MFRVDHHIPFSIFSFIAYTYLPLALAISFLTEIGTLPLKSLSSIIVNLQFGSVVPLKLLGKIGSSRVTKK